MTDTIPARVDAGDFRFDGEHYTRGDELEVPEHVLDSHPRSLTRLDEDEADGEDEAESDEESVDEDEAVEVDPHPDDLSVSELEDRIQDVDDVDLLEAILEAEREDGSPRKTAEEALEARLDELEG